MLTPGRTEHAIHAAVEAARAVQDLPAVATMGWCDRAAECLVRTVRSGTAVLAAVRIDDSGSIASFEAGGVHSGHGATAGPDGSAPIAPPRPVAPDPGVLRAIRARLLKLSHVGWSPGSLDRPTAGLLGRLPGALTWRAGPVGRLWGDPPPPELVVGLAPLGCERGRVLLAHIWPAAPAADSDVLVLRAVLPGLACRALQALGAHATDPARWLTAREQAVLDRLIRGRTIKQIAAELGRSAHTIHDHAKNLHRKLNAGTRGELVARALGAHAPASEIEPRPGAAPFPAVNPLARSA